MVVKVAEENRTWGYDRFVSAMKKELWPQSEPKERHKCPQTEWTGARSGARPQNDMEGLHSLTHFCAGSHGLLHRRGVDASRAHYLLHRAIRHADGAAAYSGGGDHEHTRWVLDESNRPEPQAGRCRIPLWLSLSASRSRHQVHSGLRHDPEISRRRTRPEPLRNVSPILAKGPQTLVTTGVRTSWHTRVSIVRNRRFANDFCQEGCRVHNPQTWTLRRTRCCPISAWSFTWL